MEVVFEEEEISLQLQNGDPTPIESSVEKDGWRMTPLNTMKVGGEGRSFH